MRNYIIFGIILIVIFIFLMKSDLFNFSDFDNQLSKIKKLMKNTKSSKRKSSKDKMQGKGATYFGVYFARGCCSEGANCKYYHRVPFELDTLTT